MGKLSRIIFLLVGLLSFWRSDLLAQNVIIHIHLFRSALKKTLPYPRQAEILTASARSELASLKEMSARSEQQFAAAVIDALLDIYDLEAVDDLFHYIKEWSGRKSINYDDIIMGQKFYYRIKIDQKRLSDQQVALHIAISRGKNSLAAAEILINQDLALDIGDPAVVVTPLNGEMFFAAILLKRIEPISSKNEQKSVPKNESNAVPRVVRLIQPSYPEELRRRRIGGIIGLFVNIDEKGNVLSVRVDQPSHPYFNYAAVQALLQWKFEPVFIKGKPSAVGFRYTYSFYPSTYEPVILSHGPWIQSAAFSSDILQKVLDQSGEYCRKLAGVALDFVCEETIKETHFSIQKNIKKQLISIVTKEGAGEIKDPYIVFPVTDIQIIDPAQTKRTKILCDYQIIRKNGMLKEQRILLEENGRKNADRTKVLEEGRVTGLSPLFAPLKILLPTQQPKYFFRIASEEKIQGRKSYVVEASPKSGDENGVWSARIWIDQERFLILKCEIEGIPIDGYEDVLDDCTVLNIRPEFVTTHEYRTEKEGMLFPWRSKVRIAYPGYSPLISIPKTDMVLTYANYRFFTVETEHQIIR